MESICPPHNKQGLKLIPADNAVEAGLHRVQTLMDSGQLKISPNCNNLLHELRMYGRNEEGKIQKRNDHLLDALRYICNTPQALTRPRPANYKPRVFSSIRQ
jgi:hypothetical protein